MVMIVLCHFFQYYGLEAAWWLNVGVQIFFTMSGFLYGRKEVTDPVDFMRRRFARILVPYYIFLFPTILLYLLLAADKLSMMDVAKSLVCSGTISGLGNLWFVSYIIFCYSVTPWLYFIRKKLENRSLVSETMIIGLLLIGFQLLSVAYSSYFNPAWISCYICGYIMAYYHKKYGDAALHILAVLCVPICIVTSGARIYFSYVSQHAFTGIAGKLVSYLETYSRAILGITIFLVLYTLLRPNAVSYKICENRIIQRVDKYSYSTYLVHQLFILSPFSCLMLTNSVVLNCAIAVAAIVVASYIHGNVADAVIKVFNKWEK